MNTEILSLLNLRCNGCSKKIKNALEGMDDVTDIQFDESTRNLNYRFQKSETPNLVLEKIKDLGYPLKNDMNPETKKTQAIVCCPASVKAHEVKN
jgi:copper chaperone CopZ